MGFHCCPSRSPAASWRTPRQTAPTQRQLGVYDGDPTIDLVLPPRSFLAVRPLTDDEIVVLTQLLAADADRHAPAGGVGAGGGYRPDVGDPPHPGLGPRLHEPPGLDPREFQGGGSLGI